MDNNLDTKIKKEIEEMIEDSIYKHIRQAIGIMLFIIDFKITGNLQIKNLFELVIYYYLYKHCWIGVLLCDFFW